MKNCPHASLSDETKSANDYVDYLYFEILFRGFSREIDSTGYKIKFCLNIKLYEIHYARKIHSTLCK